LGHFPSVPGRNLPLSRIKCTYQIKITCTIDLFTHIHKVNESIENNTKIPKLFK